MKLWLYIWSYSVRHEIVVICLVIVSAGYIFGHTKCNNCGHMDMTALFWLYIWLNGVFSTI